MTVERLNQFHNWGCNCSILNMTIEQTRNSIQSYFYPKDYMDVITIDERDSFWHGYCNKPIEITEVVKITI